jgi:hypothetical protein
MFVHEERHQNGHVAATALADVTCESAEAGMRVDHRVRDVQRVGFVSAGRKRRVCERAHTHTRKRRDQEKAFPGLEQCLQGGTPQRHVRFHQQQFGELLLVWLAGCRLQHETAILWSPQGRCSAIETNRTEHRIPQKKKRDETCTHTHTQKSSLRLTKQTLDLCSRAPAKWEDTLQQ